MMRNPGGLLLLAAAILLFVGCANGDGTSSGSGGTGSMPVGDFYQPPDPLPSDVPGTLIRAEPMEPFTDGSLAWRVLYVSTALDGTPIAVSGMVAAPSGSVPNGGRDVVSWAHGLTGLQIDAHRRGASVFSATTSTSSHRTSSARATSAWRPTTRGSARPVCIRTWLGQARAAACSTS